MVTFYAVTGKSRAGRRVGGKYSRGRAGICHVSIAHKPLHGETLKESESQGFLGVCSSSLDRSIPQRQGTRSGDQGGR